MGSGRKSFQLLEKYAIDPQHLAVVAMWNLNSLYCEITFACLKFSNIKNISSKCLT